MSNITAKELSALEDQLGYENVLIKKYRAFALQCTDTELQTKCNAIADKHQHHYNTLMGYLK